MRITFDPAKRARTLAERGLDFEDAVIVFEGVTVEVEDTRRNYGEPRMICYGFAIWQAGRSRLHPARRYASRIQHAKGQRT